MKDCLEEHREDEGFSAECKEEFEKMMERRAKDFRLDSNLRELCARDIDEVCNYEKVISMTRPTGGRKVVIPADYTGLFVAHYSRHRPLQEQLLAHQVTAAVR